MPHAWAVRKSSPRSTASGRPARAGLAARTRCDACQSPGKASALPSKPPSTAARPEAWAAAGAMALFSAPVLIRQPTGGLSPALATRRMRRSSRYRKGRTGWLASALWRTIGRAPASGENDLLGLIQATWCGAKAKVNWLMMSQPTMPSMPWSSRVSKPPGSPSCAHTSSKCTPPNSKLGILTMRVLTPSPLAPTAPDSAASAYLFHRLWPET